MFQHYLKFKLTMSLDGKAPVGSLRDVLTIVTNDRTNPYIPLLIEGAIAPDISVSPSILQVGSVSSGKAAKAFASFVSILRAICGKLG